jgi:hypothetical protein
MKLIHTYPHRQEEDGCPKTEVVFVQSTTGTKPEDANISLERWGKHIRAQLEMTEKKVIKLELRDNYELFKNIR